MDKVLVITGPTGVGKTKVSIEVADILKGEIISCDSRQTYRGMDIGTAKPKKDQRKKVLHHLLDLAFPDQKFSAADYAKVAKKKIKEVIKKGKIPVVVGGSGLYLRALCKGFFKGPKGNERIRRKLKKEMESFGKNYLYLKLKQIDPEAALRIHPNDEHRIIRALEVYELTGKKISQFQKEGEYEPEEFEFIKFGLTLKRDKLYQRIDQRVDQMIKDGLLEEVKKLKKIGYFPELLPLRTFGYKELFSYIGGKIDLGKAIELIKLNTRHYAKRQITWFKKEKDIIWLDAEKNNLVSEIVQIFSKNA